MIAGIGHNSGRAVTPGHSWRKHVWAKARRDLLPTLPIEVVRTRVKRARQLGLPYRTYAGIRASTGHDLIGFLFSNNALQVLRAGQAIPELRAQKLASLIQTRRIGIAHRPLHAMHMEELEGIDAGFSAPDFAQSWSATRDQMKAIIKSCNAPADRFVMVGDTAIEREWVAAAQMAGYLTATTYFDGTMG